MVAGAVIALLNTLSRSEREGVFHVAPIPEADGYFVGRNHLGSASVLIRTLHDGGAVPIRLAGLDATFGSQCELMTPDGKLTTERLSVIQCTSGGPENEFYFAFAMEALIAALGSSPEPSAVFGAVGNLVELFQRLRIPPRRPLTGLVGELCVIFFSRDPSRAIAAWRTDPDERFDFVCERLRLDAKASSNRRRVHSASFEQVNAPHGTIGAFASLWVEPAGGGVSFADLISKIETNLGTNQTAISRLRLIVAATLGDSLKAALGWRFDLALAQSSLQFFDAALVPAIRSSIPKGVSALRFSSDFDEVRALEVPKFARLLSAAEMNLLPVA
jgi:hypothetical protein